MKRISITVMILLIILSFTGCSSKFINGEMKSSYTPLKVGKNIETQSAIIKVADGLLVWKVDGEETTSKFQLFLPYIISNRTYSVIVDEGNHSISIKYYANNSMATMYFKEIMYKSNHEYFIDYIIYDSIINYWIKDLTDNKIVYGKEKTEKDFKK